MFDYLSTVLFDIPRQQRFHIFQCFRLCDMGQHMTDILIRLQIVGLGGFDQAVAGRTGPGTTRGIAKE